MRAISQLAMHKQTGEAIGGLAFLHQRFADAVSTERGSLVGARDYGMRLDDLLDRTMDNHFSMRFFARLTEGILHEANGLFDVRIQQFTLVADDRHMAWVTIHALWQGQNIELQTGLRRAAQ